MALRAKWQFMDRPVTHKIVYGPQLRFGPYNILWVTSRSINCHMTLSAMNYLLNIDSMSKTNYKKTNKSGLVGMEYLVGRAITDQLFFSYT